MSTSLPVHFNVTLTRKEYMYLRGSLALALMLAERELTYDLCYRLVAVNDHIFSQIEYPHAPLITIKFTLSESQCQDLLVLTGFGTGAAERLCGESGRWQMIHIVNQLFYEMPTFRQYPIPTKYRWSESQ